MPQVRTLIASHAGWRLERVHFGQHASQWSATYQAPTRRTVLPATGAAVLRVQQREWLVDELTAFCIDAATAYQLKPEGRGTRESMVLSDAQAPERAQHAINPGPRVWLLAPAELYALRLQWRALGSGSLSAGALLSPARPVSGRAVGCETRAVALARRALSAEPGRRLLWQEVAEAAHSSPFHLARQFRRATGLSLHRYRLHLRVALALAHLDAGELDLAGLAHELGFCSQSHFGEVFKRSVGATPAQARAALRLQSAGT